MDTGGRLKSLHLKTESGTETIFYITGIENRKDRKLGKRILTQKFISEAPEGISVIPRMVSIAHLVKKKHE